MGVALYVENQVHKRVEQILDDPQESIMRLCESGHESSVRRAVSRYGDTMLNIYQLRRLISELEDERGGTNAEVAARLAEAAERAIRARGYLYFVGD
jgi:pilus assembly protein TadC